MRRTPHSETHGRDYTLNSFAGSGTAPAAAAVGLSSPLGAACRAARLARKPARPGRRRCPTLRADVLLHLPQGAVAAVRRPVPAVPESARVWRRWPDARRGATDRRGLCLARIRNRSACRRRGLAPRTGRCRKQAGLPHAAGRASFARVENLYRIRNARGKRLENAGYGIRGRCLAGVQSFHHAFQKAVGLGLSQCGSPPRRPPDP